MDERERDYFRQMIRDLERAKRRWQVFAMVLLAGFVLFLVVGMGSILLYGFGTLQKQRLQAEEARAQAQAALALAAQAEDAARQLKQEEAKAKQLQDLLEKEKRTKEATKPKSIP